MRRELEVVLVAPRPVGTRLRVGVEELLVGDGHLQRGLAVEPVVRVALRAHRHREDLFVLVVEGRAQLDAVVDGRRALGERVYQLVAVGADRQARLARETIISFAGRSHFQRKPLQMGVLEAHTSSNFLIPVEATAGLVVVAVESDHEVTFVSKRSQDSNFPSTSPCSARSRPNRSMAPSISENATVASLAGVKRQVELIIININIIIRIAVVPLDAPAHGPVEGVLAAEAQGTKNDPETSPPSTSPWPSRCV